MSMHTDRLKPDITDAPMPRLKVLLVSYVFPPANMIGAVRLGKFAKYLYTAGHDVRVIAASLDDGSLALEIPPECVRYVAGRATDEIFDRIVALARRLWPGRIVSRLRAGAQAGAESTMPVRVTGRRPRLLEAAARHYWAVLHIPDGRSGWIRPASAAGYRMVENWCPDVVIGSAPPESGLIAASRIARSCSAPWVAELRDPWTDDPYYGHPAWHRHLNRLLEWHTLRSAVGLVGVTPQRTATLGRRYRKPVACISNGYAAEDFPVDPQGPPPGDVMTILYTGSIYRGFRDPSPLFCALALLGTERDRVAIHFYGPPVEDVMPLAAAHGVRDR